MAESVFGINTDNTDELGRKIGMEGNNFEELINTINKKLMNVEIIGQVLLMNHFETKLHLQQKS